MADTVLITGCSSGIGNATARTFADEGWRVYATARDVEDVSDLSAAGCETAALDVTDDENVAAVVDRIVDEAGGIDCLVNNAGYGQLGPVEDVPADRVQRQFDVNVLGPHRLTRAALPHMRERESGTIVNVSSVAGRVSVPGMGVYSGSKSAMEAISDALRPEVDPFGIDVVLVEPGPVDTSFTDRVAAEVDELDRTDEYETLYALFEDASAMGGAGPGAIPPQRVADAIFNAASLRDPAARYPVGQLARVGAYARFLPDSVRDLGYRAVLKLMDARTRLRRR